MCLLCLVLSTLNPVWVPKMRLLITENGLTQSIQEVLSTDSPPIIPAVRNAKTVFHWQNVTMLIRNFFAKHNFFLGQCPYLWVKFEVSNYCSDVQISMMFIKCQLEKMNERLMSRLQVCFVQIKISLYSIFLTGESTTGTEILSPLPPLWKNHVCYAFFGALTYNNPYQRTIPLPSPHSVKKSSCL